MKELDTVVLLTMLHVLVTVSESVVVVIDAVLDSVLLVLEELPVVPV